MNCPSNSSCTAGVRTSESRPGARASHRPIAWRMRPALVILALTLLVVNHELRAAPPEGFAGPLLGAMQADRASIWMFCPVESTGSVTCKSLEGDSKSTHAPLVPVASPAVETDGRPHLATIEGLRPESRYEYHVTVDGRTDPAWTGTFRTAPVEGAPTRVRIALTSCMKFDQPQASWYLLLGERPDLHMTVGDTHYADTTDPVVQWEHHLRYRRMPEFAHVIRNVPTLAVWDDHDFGPNNSDGTAEGKERALEGWRQFWANPALGSDGVPGAFFRHTWGDVELFVLDERYHRSPDAAPDDASKTMLGDAQFRWLIESLRSSRARFRLVAGGSTLDHSKDDGWRVYTEERHRLFDEIRRHAIPGVVYLSGDIHRSLVWEHRESDRVGYPLVEVISSGVANSADRSFATLDLDTTLEDPSLRVRIIHGDGTVRDDRTWRLSQLSGPGRRI